MWRLSADCLDEPIVLSLVPEAKPSQRLLEVGIPWPTRAQTLTSASQERGPRVFQGALLAWSTDLAVSDAVEALQGALSEEMRRF